MKRFGFLMRLLDEGAISEDERLHRSINDEVLAAHSRSGIRNYSIYRFGLELFGYFEADDPDAAIAALSQEPIMQKWWDKTNRLMAADESQRPEIKRLLEVFHMD